MADPLTEDRLLEILRQRDEARAKEEAVKKQQEETDKKLKEEQEANQRQQQELEEMKKWREEEEAQKATLRGQVELMARKGGLWSYVLTVVLTALLTSAAWYYFAVYGGSLSSTSPAQKYLRQ